MEPKSTSSSLATRSWAPAAWWFLLLAAGLGGLPVRGSNTTNTIEFVKSVPRPGSVDWKTDLDLHEKRQETYRKRLSIQDAASPFVPRAIQANLINGPKTPPVYPPSEAGAIERVLDFCFFTTILLLSAGLVARKFAPE